MSEENVEVVKEFTRRFAAGDRVTRNYFDPEIVWDTSASGMPSAGVYHGHQGVQRFFRDWLTPWDDYEIETIDCIDAGDAVLLVFPARWNGSGQRRQNRARLLRRLGAEGLEGGPLPSVRDPRAGPRSRRAVGVAPSSAAPRPTLARPRTATSGRRGGMATRNASSRPEQGGQDASLAAGARSASAWSPTPCGVAAATGGVDLGGGRWICQSWASGAVVSRAGR